MFEAADADAETGARIEVEAEVTGDDHEMSNASVALSRELDVACCGDRCWVVSE